MRSWFLRITLSLLAMQPAAAHADALSKSWQCAKSAGLSSVSVGKDLYKKGEAMATKAGPIAACLAKTGPEAQALGVTSSALTALRLAKPSLLPSGQCESRIKGVATKPFANGLASLLPASGAKSKLISVANSDGANQLVWDQIGQLPPPFSSVPNQIECGCLMSDAGLSLTDISEVTNAISDTSASCANALDSLGLGFLNDIGSYAINLGKSVVNALSDKWDEWKGQSDPGAPEAIYAYYFGDLMKPLANEMARKPGTPWNAPKFMHDTKACASTGQYEYCTKTVPQLRNECVAYYDDHKMSKGNASKVCDGYQTAMVAAATTLSKQYIARGALPPMIDKKAQNWVKDEWLWRLPRTYTPGTYDYDNGTTADGNFADPNSTAFYLKAEWYDVIGGAKFKKDAYAWEYEPTGIYAVARGVVTELGNDPARAHDIAFVAAVEPLRDKVRARWAKDRVGVARYYLRDWFPKPTFGFRYGCSSGELEAACAVAMESRFDKLCFTPMSELYVTGVSGIAFPSRYAKVKNDCSAQVQPILAASAKLDAAMPGTITNSCQTRATREELSTCNAAARKTYYDCAALALKQGKDDASKCYAGRQLGNDVLEQLKKGIVVPGQPKPETPPSRKP